MRIIEFVLAAAAIIASKGVGASSSLRAVPKKDDEPKSPPSSCPCPGEVQHFQLYHISKCGGTNARSVLHDVFHLKTSKYKYRWSFRDYEGTPWLAERENVPDPRYGAYANSPERRKTFIVGLVRNPFSYYRSLYSMLVDRSFNPHEKEYMRTGGAGYMRTGGAGFCGFQLAYETGNTDIFLGRDRDFRERDLLRNRTAFETFVKLIITKNNLPNRVRWRRHVCYNNPEDMQGRHDNLHRMNGGIMAYDAVVRQENYYPDLRAALETFDDCLPGVTDFRELQMAEEGSLKDNTRRKVWSGDNLDSLKEGKEPPIPPDYCFYSPELRTLVAENDREMMERYGYSWSSFVGSGSVEHDCQNVI